MIEWDEGVQTKQIRAWTYVTISKLFPFIKITLKIYGLKGLLQSKILNNLYEKTANAA